MVQKINPHPATGCNRSPPYYVFQKMQFLGVFRPFLQRSLPDPKDEVWKSLLACDSDSSEDCDPDWLTMKSDCDSDSSVVEFGLINLLRSLLGSKSSESEDCDPDSLSDWDSDSRIALLEGDSQNLQMINGRFKTTSGHCFANYKNIFHKTEVQTT